MRPLRQSIASGVSSEKRTPTGKFNAKMVEFKDGTGAILKKRMHSNDFFRGVPKNLAHVRENAYYALNKLMGFDLVPETLWMSVGSEKTPASLQRFVFAKEPRELVPDIFNRSHHDWKLRVLRLSSKMDLDEAKQLVVLDLLANNTDRHARNFLVSPSRKVWAIDNGLSFAPLLKGYRNVVHKYVFLKKLVLPDSIAERLHGLTLPTLEKALARYGVDYEMVLRRAKWVLKHGDDLSFHTLAKGLFGTNEFPSYRHELTGKTAPPTVLLPSDFSNVY